MDNLDDFREFKDEFEPQPVPTPEYDPQKGTGDEKFDRVINLIFILDTSISMKTYGRLDALNAAMPLAFAAAKQAADELECAGVRIRVIAFNTHAEWKLGDKENGVTCEEAVQKWVDLTSSGSTDTASAIRLCKEAMHTQYLGNKSSRPVVILVTDGCSNNPADTIQAKEELRDTMKSKKNPLDRDTVWRLAIGVQDANQQELEEFAMRGTLEDAFGNQTENVPMVFPVTDVSKLSSVLKRVTFSSLMSAGTGNTGTETMVVEI